MSARVLLLFTFLLAATGFGAGYWIATKQSKPLLAPTTDSPQQTRRVTTLLAGPDRHDPARFAAKMAAARSLPDPRQRSDSLRAVLQEWSQVDPITAYEAWSQSPGDHPPATGAGVILALQRALGFDAALETILTTGDLTAQSQALHLLASQVEDLDQPEHAVEKLRLSLPGALREDTLATALRSWTEAAEFETVAAWMDSHCESFSTGELAAFERAVSAKLVVTRPETATAWLLERATEESLPGHLQHIVDRWARFAPNAAGQWLGSLPPGPQNDLAVDRFARLVSQADPASAAHWAAAIEEEALRNAALASVLDAWKRLDPDRAAQFESSLITRD